VLLAVASIERLEINNHYDKVMKTFIKSKYIRTTMPGWLVITKPGWLVTVAVIIIDKNLK
jgi:hypothetical protein